MARKVLFSVIIAAVLGLMAAGAYSQEDMQFVDNGFFDGPRRPPALFAHDSHNDKAGLDDCARCHHVFEEDGRLSEVDSSEDRGCGDCHDLKDTGSTPGLRKAFHLRCKGCHVTMRQGPIACGQCHHHQS